MQELLFHYISPEYFISAVALYKALPLFIAFAIDGLVLGYRNSAIKRLLCPTLSAKADIILFLLISTRVMGYLSIVASFGLVYWLPKIYQQYSILAFGNPFESPILQFLFLLIIEDFLQYWRHRLGHRVSWWWQIHRFHHSATEFNVITEGRIHPLDIALNSLFVYIPLSLIGLNIETFILIKALCSLQSKLQHSMIPWRGGWIGRYLLIFPVDHRIHHSSQRVHWDKNYGHITPPSGIGFLEPGMKVSASISRLALQETGIIKKVFCTISGLLR